MANKIGRPAYEVTLTEGQRERLERVVRATTSPHSHVVRAKIALGADAGMSHEEIIAYSGASGFTVTKWRKRFSLYAELKPNQPTDSTVYQVLCRGSVLLFCRPASNGDWYW